jgi:hypothetical protein
LIYRISEPIVGLERPVIEVAGTDCAPHAVDGHHRFSRRPTVLLAQNPIQLTPTSASV